MILWRAAPWSKKQRPELSWEGSSKRQHQDPNPRAGGGGRGHSDPVCQHWAQGGAEPTAAFADLVLETWDLQSERNGREHRTAEMCGQQLVVRRGQPFTITLRFSGRAYEDGVDKLAFNVETGEWHCAPTKLPRDHRAARGHLPHLTGPLPPSQPGAEHGFCTKSEN